MGKKKQRDELKVTSAEVRLPSTNDSSTAKSFPQPVPRNSWKLRISIVLLVVWLAFLVALVLFR